MAKGSGLASYLGEMCALTTLASQFSTARYFRSNGGGAKSSCALRRVGSHNCANQSARVICLVFWIVACPCRYKNTTREATVVSNQFSGLLGAPTYTSLSLLFFFSSLLLISTRPSRPPSNFHHDLLWQGDADYFQWPGQRCPLGRSTYHHRELQQRLHQFWRLYPGYTFVACFGGPQRLLQPPLGP